MDEYRREIEKLKEESRREMEKLKKPDKSLSDKKLEELRRTLTAVAIVGGIILAILSLTEEINGFIGACMIFLLVLARFVVGYLWLGEKYEAGKGGYDLFDDDERHSLSLRNPYFGLPPDELPTDRLEKSETDMWLYKD